MIFSFSVMFFKLLATGIAQGRQDGTDEVRSHLHRLCSRLRRTFGRQGPEMTLCDLYGAVNDASRQLR